MKHSFLILVLLIWSSILKGQGYDGELKVGDKLPMSELKNMINYSSKTLKFADHKPRLTIFDVWSTTCAGCVDAWPKMLALQKEFGNDLQIVLVNRYEDEKTIKDFIAYRKKMTGIEMNLPISYEDAAFIKAFPRPAVPRYYWIDSNGVVASATRGVDVTSENIRRWIQSGPFQMDQIVEDMIWVRGNKPLFVDGNGGSNRAGAFVWSSSLTRGFLDLVGTTTEYLDPINGYGICATGSSIEILYCTAYNNRLKPSDYLTWLHGSRCELIAKDPSKYSGLINGVRTKTPRYNYQLIAGSSKTREQLQKIMQEDLDRYFGLSVSWEKRKKNCLVLTMFDSAKAQSKSRGRYAKLIGETSTALDNVDIPTMIFFMEQGSFFFDSRPIVDETGFHGLLTGIYFEAYCQDIKALDAALSKFGMHIKEEVREVDVLVLREPENSN